MKIRLLALLMLAPLLANALTASEAMGNAAAKIKAAPVITLQFSLATTNGQASDGVMVISRENFAVTTSLYSAWFNGKEMWSLNPSAGEVYLTEPTEDELLEINPFDIINSYQSRYKATLISQDKGMCTVQLKPLSAASSIKSASVAINTATWMPSHLTAEFANGVTMDIKIENVSIGQSAPMAKAFAFPRTDYPSLPIIDMR